MTETTVICDRCKQVVIDNRRLLRVEAGVLRTRAGKSELDLCGDCSEALVSFLRSAEAFALSSPR